MKPVIGFIGIGAMGKLMSENLLKAGYPLVVYDIKVQATDGLVAQGASRAATAQELANSCSVVITMLPASPDVEAVILGPRGVAEGANSGSIVIDMSSSYPGSTKMIAARLTERGIRMLDAPVSGGTRGARAGTLSIMVGGSEPNYEECRPIFDAMGKNIYYIGGIASGHTVKALNNLCSAVSLAITSEALVVATRLGLDPEKIIEVINSSSGRSWSSEYKFPNFILNGVFNTGFSMSLMNKDVEMATRLGRELHIPMFLGSMAQQLYDHAVGQGSGGDCHTAIIKLMEKWAGVTVRSKKKD